MSTHTTTTTAVRSGADLFAARHCCHELLRGTCSWCPPGSAAFSRPTLHATIVVTAWYPTLCRNPGCGHRSVVGEPVGLVAEVGPCCAACTGLRPDSPGPGDRRGWVA